MRQIRLVAVFAVIVAITIVWTVYYPITEKTNFSTVNFENIHVQNITENSAVVIGTTTVPVNCEVYYGINGQTILSTSDNDMMPMPHTEHNVILHDLQPDATYNYQLSVIIDSIPYHSEFKSFQTLNASTNNSQP